MNNKKGILIKEQVNRLIEIGYSKEHAIKIVKNWHSHNKYVQDD
jgi:hypothetical protein